MFQKRHYTTTCTTTRHVVRARVRGRPANRIWCVTFWFQGCMKMQQCLAHTHAQIRNASNKMN